MNTRKLVSAIAVTAALMLGTTGCSLTHEVESLKAYTPSDGTQLNVGDLKFRNFILLSKGTESGKSVLIGSVVNSGEADVAFGFTRENDNGQMNDQIFKVEAGKTLSFGNAGIESARVLNTGFTPGSRTTLFLWVGENTSATPLTVPVLEDKPEQYAQFFQD